MPLTRGLHWSFGLRSTISSDPFPSRPTSTPLPEICTVPRPPLTSNEPLGRECSTARQAGGQSEDEQDECREAHYVHQYRSAACACNETPVRKLLAHAPSRAAAPTGRIGGVDDILDFGRIILVVAGALSIAIFVRVFASRIGLPTAALLLIVAAVASELSDRLASLLTFQDVQRVATLALIAILFDGGTSIGLKKFRTAAVPITILGVVGTFATAPLVAVAAHYLLGFDWTVSLLIGAALAPTDPAVTFSVLAGKEVEGRSGTILEGESGFNDPVGIALMIGMIELARAPLRRDRRRRLGVSAGDGRRACRRRRRRRGDAAGVPPRAAARPLALPAGRDPRRRGRLRPRRGRATARGSSPSSSPGS